jgi:hypothetical protein
VIFRRRGRQGFLWAAVAVAAATLAAAPPDPVPTPNEDEDAEPQVNAEALSIEPANPGPPVIQAPRLNDLAEGKGRLRLDLSGNRRWCTSPDDRVVKPPEMQRPPNAPKAPRGQIYTYGYQFTIAAVARARPEVVVMLFESPVFRTAVLRQAAKLGKGSKKPPGPATIEPEGSGTMVRAQETPNQLIPMWQEQYRCATLQDGFDFDLDPGTYDIYMAFDTMNRSGGWAHRSIGFTTEVEVRQGLTTRLDGVVDMAAGSHRTVAIRGASLVPANGSGAP